MEAEKYIIECDNLVKIYKTEETEVMALQGLDCKVREGELMAIIGNSGSGKSTFLNMLGGLDKPTAGRLYVDGLDLFRLSEKELVAYKRSTVGFVWQNNARNLIPYLPAWQNVQMPMLFENGTQKSCWSWWAFPTRQRAAWEKCPAASSSAWPSPSPWPTIPGCCWRTNPPARWTLPPPPISSIPSSG